MSTECPVYDEIKTRAFELVIADEGFNGYLREEILAYAKERGRLHNTIGVAVCCARDEVYARVKDEGMSLEQRAAACRNLHFTKVRFHKAVAEVARLTRDFSYARDDSMMLTRALMAQEQGKQS